MKNSLHYCTACEEHKDVKLFSLTPSGNPRNHCKPCRVVKNKYHYDKTYGISYEEVIDLKEQQDYKCAICGVMESEHSRGTLFVDHCHVTNKVRGLLCSHCNTMLGMAKDSPLILATAISYLKERG